jgi:diacylglycerol kinase (ATP)
MLVARRVVPARRVDVIVNRLARYLVADDGLAQVYARACREAGATLHETRSAEELDAVCQRLAARGTDCVVLAGGDGSYMAGTSALVRSFRESLPTLAFAPGGTASTVARNWGFHGRKEDYARRVVAAAAAQGGAVTARPTLRLRDDTGREAVGFIFGAGLVATFFDAYYASAVQGYAGAAILVARIFAGSFVGGDLARRVLEPVAMSLAIDGEACEARAFSLVAASVVHNLGLHMILLHRAAEDAGRVHVVASPLGAGALGPQLPRVLSGRRLRGKGHVDALARELVLQFPQPAGLRSYVLDGELLRAREVRVSAGPVIRHLAG